MAMQELAEDFWTTKAEAVVGFLLVQDTDTTRMNSTSDLFWQHAVNFWHLNGATRNQKKRSLDGRTKPMMKLRYSLNTVLVGSVINASSFWSCHHGGCHHIKNGEP